MAVKFKSLSSGSCGNCYFLGAFGEQGDCEAGILIDAGVSPRRLKKELLQDHLDLSIINGIIVTHDHLDHIRSLGSYCKHFKRKVWATARLHNALARHTMCRDWIDSCRCDLQEGWNVIVPGRISVRWFEVPHDASQTVGYAILIDGHKFVIMTDTGRITDEALAWACQADTVVIESNYDTYMLEHGPYPRDLQERIRNGHGHLSNAECSDAIARFLHPGLRSIFLCHLSEHNNTPKLALEESRKPLTGDYAGLRLVPLPRQTASPLFTL